MKLLCIEYKVVSVDYFMDTMQEYELDFLLDNLSYSDRFEWERCRLQAYSTVQCQSTKKLTPKDIITFPWEKEFKDLEKEKEPILSQEEVDRRRQEFLKRVIK